MRMIVTAAMIAMLAAAPAVAKKEKRETGAQPGELILHEMTDYNGDYYSIDQERASVQTEWKIRSISMHAGESWEICARPRFRDCITLSQSVADASLIGVQDQIGSARKAVAGR
jgi:hypothetical protein